MSDNHGNTPAAWAAVAVAMLGFVVGGIGLMFNPISLPVFWVGVAHRCRVAGGLRGDGQDGSQRPGSLMTLAAEPLTARPAVGADARRRCSARRRGRRDASRCTCATPTSPTRGASARSTR